jgi:hypothetical protein
MTGTTSPGPIGSDNSAYPVLPEAALLAQNLARNRGYAVFPCRCPQRTP